jgi:hypothetical protein
VLHDLVVLEDVLADLEVAFLDLALGAFDALESIGCSMASPSFMPRRARTFMVVSPANIFMRSSSRETKKRDEPLSPWRPERPRSWLSMRRASWRSVPMTCRPPISSMVLNQWMRWRRKRPSCRAHSEVLGGHALDVLGLDPRVGSGPVAQQHQLKIGEGHVLDLALLDVEELRAILRYTPSRSSSVSGIDRDGARADAALEPVLQQRVAGDLRRA